jgi:hypothetical protein
LPAERSRRVCQATIFCPGILLQETDVVDLAKPFFAELPDQRNVYCLSVNVQGLFFARLQDAADMFTQTLSLWANPRRATPRSEYLKRQLVETDGIRSLIIKGGIKEILKRTSVAALLSAVALPYSIYSWSTSLLDGQWVRGIVSARSGGSNISHVAQERAKQAGDLLADVLLEKVQGQRPVMLVGVSCTSPAHMFHH